MATKTKTKPAAQSVETKSRLRPALRKGALAYVGIYGLAYDRIQMRRAQAKALTENLFDDLAEKGETTVKQAEVLFKYAQKGAWENYAGATEKLTDALPVKIKSRVEVLEDELTQLQATFDRLSKTAAMEAKKTKKAVTKKAKATKTNVTKAVAETVETIVEKTETVVKAAPVTAEVKTPRHIPYFLEVKRYDPMANEDVVRKIVNHCGIALRNEDARYVACSDESERVTVRESWLKRKLALTATDADLDKKVLEVCTLMQRDQKKNRVTFYYLLAKKERLLETI